MREQVLDFPLINLGALIRSAPFDNVWTWGSAGKCVNLGKQPWK
jgi:hypothetical protein